MIITIQSTYESIQTADQALRNFLAGAHVADEIAQACELALHELLTNLVDHAYEGSASGQIQVEAMTDGSTLRMETRDTGLAAHIDLSRVSMPDPDDLAEGGYGLALIQALMDEVTYQRENGQNIWRLVKYP